jgi:kynureninase
VDIWSGQYAAELDQADGLAAYRERFRIPQRDGAPLVYLAGNSTGLQPRAAAGLVERELHDWAELAADGHFGAATPWYSYHEALREPVARLAGAMPSEVVSMNALTVNLHLMLVSFYRPTPQRHKVLMEAFTFPSDIYAVKSHITYHGFDPSDSLVIARPAQGEYRLGTEQVLDILDRQGESIALVMMSGVQFFTGQVFDMQPITAAARRRGAVVGWDLAHAIGNVPLELHDWEVDFAVWCSYKYLNGGPGAVGGCFVHERHADNGSLPRLAGWWSNRPETRFELKPELDLQSGADGWQVSNPPILAMAPLRAALDIFDQAGMAALRQKSVQLTGYLRRLIESIGSPALNIITPDRTEAQGCQLSLTCNADVERLHAALLARGVVCDLRRPNVIRVAPVPLYNTYAEVLQFAGILRQELDRLA